MIIKNEDVEAIDFDGLTILDYTARCEEKSSFAVIRVPSGVCHKLSWSKRSDKFYYVMDGRIDFTVNGASHVLDKGDFCIVKKGDKFRYTNNSGKAVSLILVHTPGFELGEEVFE